MLFSPAQAESNLTKDLSFDLGVSVGCFGVCLNYDVAVSDKLDIGGTTTVLLVMNSFALYAQYELLSGVRSLIYIEPSVGSIISPISREITYGGELSLGWEGSLDDTRFFHVQAGGGGIYDLEEVVFWPDIRFGIGTRL